MTDRDELNYGSYLALDELLQLQRPRSSPEHPDELLFIVVHQASELWFKVILHELDGLVAALGAGDTLGAVAALKRVNALVRIVAAQLSALETLPPQRFAQFRAVEAASGLRDQHFMHALAEHGPIPPAVQAALDRPTLQDLFERHLEAQGITLEQVYTEPAHAALFLLAEGLLEYEQGFGLWRFLHVQLVERIIGPDTGGTGGTLGAKYLQRTTTLRFFPRLWSVRGRLYAPAGGAP